MGRMDGESVKRTDYTQLPEVWELLEILEREEKRPVAAGKEKLHYADFSLAVVRGHDEICSAIFKTLPRERAG